MNTPSVCLQYENKWVSVTEERFCEPWSGWVKWHCLLKSMYECLTGKLQMSYEVDVELKDTLTLIDGVERIAHVCLCVQRN